MNWILVVIGVGILLIPFVEGYLGKTDSKTALLFSFLFYLALIGTFIIRLINDFDYVKLLLILLLIILGGLGYYKRYKKIDVPIDRLKD